MNWTITILLKLKNLLDYSSDSNQVDNQIQSSWRYSGIKWKQYSRLFKVASNYSWPKYPVELNSTVSFWRGCPSVTLLFNLLLLLILLLLVNEISQVVYDLTVEHYFQALDFNKRKKETKKSYKLTTSLKRWFIFLPEQRNWCCSSS